MAGRPFLNIGPISAIVIFGRFHRFRIAQNRLFKIDNNMASISSLAAPDPQIVRVDEPGIRIILVQTVKEIENLLAYKVVVCVDVDCDVAWGAVVSDCQIAVS